LFLVDAVFSIVDLILCVVFVQESALAVCIQLDGTGLFCTALAARSFWDQRYVLLVSNALALFFAFVVSVACPENSRGRQAFGRVIE
jgi:hypothetical protein